MFKHPKKLLKEIKEDLKNTAENVSELVIRAKDVVFDESIQKTIKEFIMIVEEKNRLAIEKDEEYLVGDDKKKAVISRLSEWVSNLTGSTEQAISFVETNQINIETIINDYISFSDKMHGKATLFEAEKIIQEQLKKQ